MNVEQESKINSTIEGIRENVKKNLDGKQRGEERWGKGEERERNIEGEGERDEHELGVGKRD